MGPTEGTVEGVPGIHEHLAVGPTESTVNGDQRGQTAQKRNPDVPVEGS